MQVKRKKTALGQRNCAEGVRPDPEKVKAVKEFPQLPTSKRADLVKWVKSILGLVSYYRRFFPRFPEVAKPLMDLTMDKTLFICGALHQKSFDELKERLAYAAVLAYLDYSREFEILMRLILRMPCVSVGSEKVWFFIWGQPIRIVTDHHALFWLSQRRIWRYVSLDG